MKLRWRVQKTIWEETPSSFKIPERMKKVTYEKHKLQQKIKGKWVDIPTEVIERTIKR